MVAYGGSREGPLARSRGGGGDSRSSGGGMGGAREGGRPGRQFAGAAFEGRKFGILAFALQCVSVFIFNFHLFSALKMGVAVWTGPD